MFQVGYQTISKDTGRLNRLALMIIFGRDTCRALLGKPKAKLSLDLSRADSANLKKNIWVETAEKRAFQRTGRGPHYYHCHSMKRTVG